METAYFQFLSEVLKFTVKRNSFLVYFLYTTQKGIERKCGAVAIFKIPMAGTLPRTVTASVAFT